jgi:hypothetical protein
LFLSFHCFTLCLVFSQFCIIVFVGLNFWHFPFARKILNMPKEMNAASTKVLLWFNSSSLPIYLYLVMPWHVLSPCYAQHVYTRGIKGYVTYYLACHVRLQVQNMPYYMRLRVQNILGCRLRKYGRIWADWRKKSRQYFCTDCIHFPALPFCPPLLLIEWQLWRSTR